MNNKKNRTRFILRLEGIKASDILARYNILPLPMKDIEESFAVTKIQPKITNFKDITTMKLLLEDGSDYPEYTNSRCKWDHYPFETNPIGMPIKYIYKDGIHNFFCEGFFCSLNCAKSYIKRHYRDSPIFSNVMTNFKLLCCLVYGYNIEILEANDWELLECYNHGDGLNIDDFRKGLVVYRKTHNIKLLPCGHFYEKRCHPLKVS